MDYSKLIRLAESKPTDKSGMKKLEERHRAREATFENNSRRHAVTEDFLARTYVL